MWARCIPPPGWLLLALLAAGSLHRWLPIAHLLRPPVTWLGSAPVIAGVVLAAAALGAFRRAGTSVIPFEKSTALVTSGIYRFTRNPMYLGLALVLTGAAWLLGTLGAFVPLPLFVWIIRHGYIRGEERLLEETFGGEYLAYKSRVRRWF